MQLLENLVQGGPILNSVFVSLLLMSCASWYIIFIKSSRLRHEYRCYHEFFNKYATSKDWAAKPNFEDVLNKILLNNTRKQGKQQILVLHFLLAEVVELQKILSSSLETNQRKEIISMHLLQSLDAIRLSLDRGLTILASIGSVAPFVGLFGTVWGIYHALGSIALSGNAGLNVVAGPIGEALVATAVGLFAAGP